MSSESADGPTAVEQAYDALMAFVNAAPVGSRLPPERTLAVRLGVSRSTLRTAVDRLERLGFLKVRHGAGTIIQEPSAAALALPYRELFAGSTVKRSQLFELRRLLEPRLAALAAKRRSPAEAAALESAARAGSNEFYVGVAAASSNELAAALVGLLVELVDAARPGDVSGITLSSESLELLRQQRVSVSVAISAGDQNSARDAMAMHLRTVGRLIGSSGR